MQRQLRSAAKKRKLEGTQQLPVVQSSKSKNAVTVPVAIKHGRKRITRTTRAKASATSEDVQGEREEDSIAVDDTAVQQDLDSNNNENYDPPKPVATHDPTVSDSESSQSIQLDAIISEDSTSQSSSFSRPKSAKRSKKEYKCHICEKQFQGLNDLRKHLRIHSDERPYECTECGKKFRQAGCLKNHVASQHGTEEEYACTFCDKKFPIKERLRLHLRVHTGEKPYKCDLCDKEFARGGQLSQHRSTHYGHKRYRCGQCDGAFTCSANLKLHVKSHKNERDFTCHRCGKRFLRPDALNKHLACFHENVKAFHCPICNKMFKGHLPQHMRIHNNVKPHGCADCGTTFTQRSQLVVHQRIHSGERPYRCQVCWQAFAHSSVLKLHIRKHTGEKPFKCLLCVDSGTAFSQLPHLKKHMASIHKQTNPYICEGCYESFKMKVEYQAHTSDCEKYKKKHAEEGEDGDHSEIDMPMSLGRMRLLVAVLIKKISTEERLKALGFEKRLIDNVLIDSLKSGKRETCEDKSLGEGERLKVNVRELLNWTVPAGVMEEFRSQQRSTEELLEELTS